MKKEFITSMLLTLTLVLSASAFAADKKDSSKVKETAVVTYTTKQNVTVKNNKIKLKPSTKNHKKEVKKNSEMKKMDHKESKTEHKKK